MHERGGSAGAGGSAGSATAAGGSGVGNAGSAGSMTIVSPPSCERDPSELALCDQRVRADSLAHRELYTWTTAEQVAELRAGGRLLIVGQTEGQERGHAFTAIEGLAAAGSGTAQMLLGRLSELFRYFRYAWPHPWATRMGWPGENYGDELVRVVLKQEAWIASVRAGAVSVVDLDNQPVPLEDALSTAERIAAIFFEKDAASGGPECIRGSFDQAIGSGGYREFILGSEAMIEEWSLSTPEIRARIDADIARLRRFLEATRGGAVSAENFNARVVCAWQWGDGPGELGAYEQSLAIPSDLYVPTAQNVANLIDTLSSDPFDPDPLVVRPGDLEARP